MIGGGKQNRRAQTAKRLYQGRVCLSFLINALPRRFRFAAVAIFFGA